MKKHNLLIVLILCLSFNQVFSNNIITLDLSKPTKPPVITLNEKGYWTETYNTAEEFRFIEFDIFSFTHTLHAFGGEDVGDGMSYWDGFIYCTNGDNTDYGETGNSNGWIPEQWGCMAGGGIKTDAAGKILTDSEGKVLVEKGIPYLVAYWGYYKELNEGFHPCLQVNFKENELYRPVGVYINNHPWPYYGNIHGDGFASPFTEEGDYFKLFIHGFNEEKEDVGVTIELTLAEFKDGELHQRDDWQWVDLSPLGSVSGLYFTMESTDVHEIEELGPNTAVYFCLDKLQVRRSEQSTAPSRPSKLIASSEETTIDCSWIGSTGIDGVKGYNLYLNGEQKAFVTATNHHFTDLSAFTVYKIEVEAVGTDDVVSDRTSTTVKTTDITPPTKPSNLRATTTESTMTLWWDASTDNVEVFEYRIYRNGKFARRTTKQTVAFKFLKPSTTFLMEVEALDESGNASERETLEVTTEATTGLITISENTSIYYNSFDYSVNLETKNATELKIYDIKGALLLSRKINPGKSKINVSHLPPGIYIVQSNNKSFKFVK